VRGSTDSTIISLRYWTKIGSGRLGRLLGSGFVLSGYSSQHCALGSRSSAEEYHGSPVSLSTTQYDTMLLLLLLLLLLFLFLFFFFLIVISVVQLVAFDI
jgi:hypothetical protein